jgi:metalloendopeptidase OMA1, mitochondrial
MKRIAPLRLALAALTMTAVAACETVPVTGRSQFNVVDEGTESKLGEQAFAEIKAKSKISKDPAANAMVQRVAQRVAQASGLNENWEFIVIDEPQVNAFALPGGKIAVYTGILPVAGDDNGLATVLSHEVGHVMAHHAAERISQAQVIDAGTGVAAVLLGGATGTDPNTMAGLLGAGASVGLTLPFGRQQEYEADRIGLTLMARAGYDPRAAIGFWQRMAQASKGGPPEFLSTHPTDENRIARIQELMPEALAQYRQK